MHALVICETQFGNTEQIAQAIAKALAGRGVVRLQPIEKADLSTFEGADLLVLGSPTQYDEATPDMLAWLNRIHPRILDELAVAVFDTRYHMSRLFSGSAAQVIGKEVQRRGGTLVAPPESFFVADRHGPLEAGEVERAASWANTLLDALGARAAPRSGESLT